MGPDQQDGAGPEQLSEQGRATVRREAVEESGWWGLVLSSSGGGIVGSGIRGDQNLRHDEVKFGRAIYYDSTASGPL